MSSNNAVPMVQGTPVVGVDIAAADGSNNKTATSYHAVSSPSGAADAAYFAAHDDDAQHIQQSHQYQDVVWALAFLAHLVIVVAIIVMGLLEDASQDDQQQQQQEGQPASYSSILAMVGVTGVTAIGLSVVTLRFMMQQTEILVQTALIFSVASSLVVGIIGFMVGSMWMGILGLLSFAIGIWYAKVVWPRIPFAAVNLQTAITAVQQNMGLMAIAMGFTVLAFAWTLLFFMGLGDALVGSKLPVVFLLFLSYYWVHQVFQNTMHVTTAGTVATWWMIPDEASAWWSPAIKDSLVRATTTSFGSICFGSFLVALVQALRALEHYTRDNEDLGMVRCVVQCILSCIESIIEYINRWAYVYCGMYGMSYLDAGRNVITLFQSKGWTVIITDDLADNVLSMMSIAIGLASGLVGLVVSYLYPNLLANYGFDSVHGPAFLVGFLSGFLFSTVLLSVVGSAINTVIVCYAEDPAAFQTNHPQLSSKMRAAWVQAWPGVIS